MSTRHPQPGALLRALAFAACMAAALTACGGGDPEDETCAAPAQPASGMQAIPAEPCRSASL